ncbi:MAG: hypothetical protein JXA67_19045 [Micromonosporaceae bacterium]|nr:hypothetical protein [Micromonosporaceae bacterium]
MTETHPPVQWHGGDQGAEATGHPEVDAVLAGLADVSQMPPAQQVARYAEAHRALAETLRTIDAS